MRDVTDSAHGALAEQLHDAGFLVLLSYEIESAAAAALLGVTPKTLRNLRSALEGPRWRVARGIAWYRLEDVLSWAAERGTHASLPRRRRAVHAARP